MTIIVDSAEPKRVKLLEIAKKDGFYQFRLLAFCCISAIIAGIFSHFYPFLCWIPNIVSSHEPLADLFEEITKAMENPENKAKLARRVSIITANTHLPNIGGHYLHVLILLLLASTLGILLLIPFIWLSGRRIGHALALSFVILSVSFALWQKMLYLNAGAFALTALAASALLSSALQHFWESAGGQTRELGPSIAHFFFTLGALIVVLVNNFAKSYRITYVGALFLALILAIRLFFLFGSPTRYLRKQNIAALTATLIKICKENNKSSESAVKAIEIEIELNKSEPNRLTLLGESEESVSGALWFRVLGAALVNANFAFAYFSLCFVNQIYKGEFSEIPTIFVLFFDLFGGILSMALLTRFRRKPVLIAIAALTAVASLTQSEAIENFILPFVPYYLFGLFAFSSLRLLTCAASGVALTYLFELVPSAYRGFALWLVAAFARGFSMVSINYFIGRPFARVSQLFALGFGAVLTLAIVACLPETNR